MEALDKAKKYAYRLLSIRPRSCRELADRLARRGAKEDVIRITVAGLKAEGLIDDLKFSKAWISSRLRLNPKGAAAIGRELNKKGVSEETIKRALSEECVDDMKTAMGAARERMKKLKGLPAAVRKRKLFAYMAQRGFDFDVIDDVIGSASESGD
ncbi:MAG: regulatory protein RecX [Candidatus Omnitrophota bacterium]